MNSSEWLATFLVPACALAGGEDLKSLWRVRGAHDFHAALRPGAGFSFSLDGKEAGRLEAAAQSGGAETTFRHPSGLAVIRRARAFPDSDAVEFTLRFKNESQAELPALANVNALDVTFAGDIVKGLSVVTSGGGGADAAFPPKDFAVARTPLGPAREEVMLTSEGGFPSKVNLPFFLVENETKAVGLYIGIGWTGAWRASIRANASDGTLRIQSGVPDISLKLRPGEEISGPSILIGAFRGPLASGSNALRRLIRDHYAPSVGGKPLVAPVLYTTWFDICAELDEKLFRTLVDQAAAIGIEVFLLDAGWYKGTPTRPATDMGATWVAISSSLGNWEQGEDLARFPSGLKALADLVRSKGMQFGLWFEPERSGPESLLAKSHPDWVIFAPKAKWGLVDFGKREVQDYFCRILDRYIKDLGLRYIRWDANHHDLLRFWATRDAPDRQGLSQIRHIEGLHRVEDWLIKNHPDVVLESCAGGGRRIDLATLQRRHTIWISDQTMDPQSVRFHLEGLNQFIPGSGQGVAFSPRPNTYRQPGFAFPDIAYQSCFGGAFGAAGRLHEWPQAMKDQARRHFDAFKKLRRFLSEDFYPLTPQPRTLDAWSGWQFHDPRTGEGFVQAFRLRSPEPARRFPLSALDPKSRYQFANPYTGETFDAPGAALCSEGMPFRLPEMSSQVFTYRRTQGVGRRGPGGT